MVASAQEGADYEGLLERLAAGCTHDISTAVDALSAMGLREPSPGFQVALRLALTHSSFWYENAELYPGVTRGLLDALQRLGSEFVRRQSAIEVFRLGKAETVGALSKAVSLLPSALRSWAVEQEWIAGSAAVGLSLVNGPLPSRAIIVLFYQVVGVACLTAQHEAFATLVGRIAEGADRSIPDPKTELQERLPNHSLKYEYEHEGPEHQKVFRASVTDARGRRGVGLGPSKKAASRQAAEDFLRQYLPMAFGTQMTRALKPRPMEIPRRRDHTLAVDRVQELFSLPVTARPLLSQALIHSSWAFENKGLMATCRQENNQVLGFVGSQVLNYEHALAVARHVLSDPPNELVLQTAMNEAHDAAFRYSGLVNGLLMGAGQSSHGIPVEMGSNAFQALVAAVYIGLNYPASLRLAWPAEWAEIWALVASDLPREFDSTTLLHLRASAMKLELDFLFRVTGPDHRQEQHASAVLSSEELGRKITVEGAGVPGKVKAKHQASQIILNVLDRLADRRPAHALGTRDDHVRWGRFLVSHQALVLAAERISIARWADARLFGMHLASSSAELVEWARGADDLLAQTSDFSEHLGRLEHAFRAAIALSGERTAEIESELAGVLDCLEQLELPADLTGDQLSRLILLADLYRCLGSKGGDISLDRLADDWLLLYGNRLQAPVSMPDMQLTGRERTVLDAAASYTLTACGLTSVRIVSATPLRLSFLADAPLDEAESARICALWSSVTKTATLTPCVRGVEVLIHPLTGPRSAGPITQAVLAALRPAAQPYQAAVADLLHDLKNQLTAARQAVSAPADTRTALLEQQLAASRHLDAAHALTARLRATSSLLGPTGNESVDIGAFLRQYASGVLARLPASISLAIPDAPESVLVAMDRRALTAVMDNLVGNAVEALSGGGAIGLEWVADGDDVIVGVRDDGPGVPDDVLAALETGERVNSTKAGGNGLGLLGVRSLLARSGGELTAHSASSGTTWFITLPIVPMTTNEFQ